MDPKVRTMMIDERLRAIADALPDDGSVSFTRTALLTMLAVETQPFGAGAQSAREGAVSVDLTVAEVANLLHRAPGTVRGWCATGELPHAYRLHGREWRIPAPAVEAFQKRQAERHAADHDSAMRSPAASEGDLGAWRSIKSNAQRGPMKHRKQRPSFGRTDARAVAVTK